MRVSYRQRSLNVRSVSPCPPCSRPVFDKFLARCRKGVLIPAAAHVQNVHPSGFDVLLRGQAVRGRRTAADSSTPSARPSTSSSTSARSRRLLRPADYYMVAILDRPGRDYSSRAAAYCVADQSIDAFRRFHAALHTHQPAETDYLVLAMSTGVWVPEY